MEEELSGGEMSKGEMLFRVLSSCSSLSLPCRLASNQAYITSILCTYISPSLAALCCPVASLCLLAALPLPLPGCRRATLVHARPPNDDKLPVVSVSCDSVPGSAARFSNDKSDDQSRDKSEEKKKKKKKK